MHRNRKLAFLKVGDFSHINASVLELLTTNFPDFHIDVIEVPDLLSKKDVRALIYRLKGFGSRLLPSRKAASRSFFKTPYAFNRIKRALLDRLADQEYGFTFQTQSLFDGSLPGVPHFVYTDHTYLASLRSPGVKPDPSFVKSWLECERTVYQNASLTLTMSSNISRSIIEDYSCSPSKVSCVYAGANVQVTKDEAFDQKRFSNKNILFVGVDWERKGGPVLVEAFRTVLATFPDATLTIVGCAPKLDIPNCHVVGKAPLSDVKKYFMQASAFCLPTTSEPFGIVFLEAMAHKLPIVASNIEAIPDFVHEGKNGYLVEPNNSIQLSQKIIDLIGSHERCRIFGEYGHDLFWGRYTWEKTGIRIRENIEKFLV
jgi:glycosyltransferase involved in cell wall biosynthesis